MELENYLKLEFLNNTVDNILIFFGILILGFIFRRIISRILCAVIFRVFEKSKQIVSRAELYALLRKPLELVLFLGVLFMASSVLTIPKQFDLAPSNEFGIQMIVSRLFLTIFIYSIFWILLKLVDFFGIILKHKASLTETKMDDQLIPFAMDLIKIFLAIILILTVLSSVFNIDVTAMAAGLGIGGIAIAMASKESIENLLGSFTIFFDKPFTVGDAINVGGVVGVVEKVGFRSTRVRTYDKSIVTVPNKNMVNAELDNLGVRPVRRVNFVIGLSYSTTVEQLKSITREIQVMLDEHVSTNQDGRVRFQEFGSSSLDIMVVYFVNSPSWDDLIDVRQDVNFRIIEIVNKHGAEFAFPSTSVYFESGLKVSN